MREDERGMTLIRERNANDSVSDTELGQTPMMLPSGPPDEAFLVDLSAQAVIDRLEEIAQVNHFLDLVVSRVLEWQQQEPVAEIAPGVDSTAAASQLRPNPIKLTFNHGLGDCAQFAHVLALYQRYGHKFEVACASDKEVLFQAAGAKTNCGAAGSCANDEGLNVEWYEANDVDSTAVAEYWRYNKAGINLNREPLPALGELQDVWSELCQNACYDRFWKTIIRESLNFSPLVTQLVSASAGRDPYRL